MNYLNNPDTPLLKFSKNSKDDWLIDDAFKGTCIFGSTGSGKSSGSGHALAKTFLQAGFGGLVLCAKPNEADTWRNYCKETGRENSLIIMDGSGKKRFNFLDYELARVDAGNHTTPFAVDAFMKIYEAMQVYDGASGGGGGNESFWKNSVRLLLSHSIDAVYLAYGELKFNVLMDFIRTAPKSQREAVESNSFHMETLGRGRGVINHLERIGSGLYPAEKAIFDAVSGYLFGFYDLDNKTRSNILATLESMVLDFTKGNLVNIFCSDTNIVPEMSHHGAVIVLDFPLKQWQRGGVLAQSLFKFSWQLAAERRKVDHTTRPIFLWADEYQLFISEYDNEFQSTARSSRVCTVYLTQSIPALRTAIKSNIPKEAVDSLLNNLKTRVIHSCIDEVSQKWAADCIGKSLQWRYSQSSGSSTGNTWGESSGQSVGVSYGSSSATTDGFQYHSHNNPTGATSGSGGGRNRGSNYGANQGRNSGNNYGETVGGSTSSNTGESKHQVMDYSLEPSYFGANLREGGKKNGFLVDGVFLVGGRTWSNGKTWLTCSFKQPFNQ